MANSIIDNGPGNHTGTTSGNPGFGQSLLGNYVDLDGTDDYISVADHADFSFGDASTDSAFTISAWVNMDDATNFRVISKGVYNVDAEYRIEMDGADKLLLFLMDESVASCYIGRTYDTALTSYEGQWIHIAATYDGTGYNAGVYGIKLYLNGVQVDDANTESNQASYVAMENLTGEVEIGKYAAGYANGKIASTQIYSEEKSADWVLKEYQRGARAVQYKTDWGVNESVANETAGELSNSDWQISTGTWKVENSSINGETVKCFTNIAPGVLYLPIDHYMTSAEAGYGTWEFWARKNVKGDTLRIMLMADVIGAYNAAGQDGLMFQVPTTDALWMTTCTNGSNVDDQYTADDYVTPATWHKFKFTRSPAGVWTSYLDDVIVDNTGGSGSNPHTNATNTASNYLNLDFTAGVKFAIASRTGDKSFIKTIGVI